MFTPTQIDELVEMFAAGAEGGTVYASRITGDPADHGRYVVGGYGGRTGTVPHAGVVNAWLKEDLRDALIRVAHHAADTLGFWAEHNVDGWGRDEIRVDPGSLLTYREEALALARGRGETAIWDIVDEVEIYVDYGKEDLLEEARAEKADEIKRENA